MIPEHMCVQTAIRTSPRVRTSRNCHLFDHLSLVLATAVNLYNNELQNYNKVVIFHGFVEFFYNDAIITLLFFHIIIKKLHRVKPYDGHCFCRSDLHTCTFA